MTYFDSVEADAIRALRDASLSLMPVVALGNDLD